MIEIRYKEKNVLEGKEYLLEVQGHAEYAEPGKDIVCAGVSSLTIALVKTLRSQEDIYYTRNNVKISEGYVKIKVVVPKEEDITKLDMVFNTILEGYKHIETEYPDNVRVV